MRGGGEPQTTVKTICSSKPSKYTFLSTKKGSQDAALSTSTTFSSLCPSYKFNISYPQIFFGNEYLKYNNAIGNTVCNATGNAIDNTIGDAISNAIGIAIGKAIGNSIGNAIGNPICNKTS